MLLYPLEQRKVERNFSNRRMSKGSGSGEGLGAAIQSKMSSSAIRPRDILALIWPRNPSRGQLIWQGA